MKIKEIQQKLRPWMLPIAMLLGIIFHDSIHTLAFLSPYLIFAMLFITYCRLSLREMRMSRFIWALLAVQIGLGIILYYILRPFDTEIAQSTFICVFCPTATAAPVVTGMLGGSIALVATYSLASNIAVALLAPVLFTMFGATAHISMLDIAMRVFPLIVFPLIAAVILDFVSPRLHRAVSSHQSLSFYIWAVSLLIVVGNAVSFVISEPHGMIPEMIAMALLSLVVCVAQFAIGRAIGARLGDKISCAQSLGQKNTVLAIWMALSYFNPITSVGAAAYVGWQNGINSIQLYIKMRKEAHRR